VIVNSSHVVVIPTAFLTGRVNSEIQIVGALEFICNQRSSSLLFRPPRLGKTCLALLEPLGRYKYAFYSGGYGVCCSSGSEYTILASFPACVRIDRFGCISCVCQRLQKSPTALFSRLGLLFRRSFGIESDAARPGGAGSKAALVCTRLRAARQGRDRCSPNRAVAGSESPPPWLRAIPRASHAHPRPRR
jgi:hypothetical protein